LIGCLARVTIAEAHPHSLKGQLCNLRLIRKFRKEDLGTFPREVPC
jgi:hypothetical protein